MPWLPCSASVSIGSSLYFTAYQRCLHLILLLEKVISMDILQLITSYILKLVQKLYVITGTRGFQMPFFVGKGNYKAGRTDQMPSWNWVRSEKSRELENRWRCLRNRVCTGVDFSTWGTREGPSTGQESEVEGNLGAEDGMRSIAQHRFFLLCHFLILVLLPRDQGDAPELESSDSGAENLQCLCGNQCRSPCSQVPLFQAHSVLCSTDTMSPPVLQNIPDLI